jgi:uncharacterized protein with von Willebrand factor type A (vWA) domain
VAAGDLAEVAALLGGELRRAGLPVGPGRCERFARAVTLARPGTPRALYLCAQATLVSSQGHIPTLERVFGEIFGGLAPGRPGGLPPEIPLPGSPERTPEDLLASAAAAAREHAASRPAPNGQQTAADRDPDPGDDGGPDDDAVTENRFLGSTTERLAGQDFAELTPGELAQLAGLMRTLTLATPRRRSRRYRRHPGGRHLDVRATLSQARRTGGDPVRLIGRNPAWRPRRLVILCDISGSMEPYARAMIQLLYCAAGGAKAEVFTFATRLTRLTAALAHSTPAAALALAGQAAPDWLGGTRIGASLREFSDLYGRRGMARGAVVVIISDGWDTGDPAELGRQMERLSMVAYRIIWVNPRTKTAGYQPLAGGMAAAWPHCDLVLSGHTLRALGELADALADPVRRRVLPAPRRRPAAASPAAAS